MRRFGLGYFVLLTAMAALAACDNSGNSSAPSSAASSSTGSGTGSAGASTGGSSGNSSGSSTAASTSGVTSGSSSASPPAAPVTKSIRQWVSCDENTDETDQLEEALQMAADGAFTLVVDCPVRLHTGDQMAHSIAVPDGVTVQFEGAGEFLGVHSGAPALSVAHPSSVTFINWFYTYL